MKTNIVILCIMILVSFYACAMGSKSVRRPERKVTDKFFVPCTKKMLKGKDPMWKFCNKKCIKWVNKKCKESKITVLSRDIDADFVFLKNGAFILISEDQVL